MAFLDFGVKDNLVLLVLESEEQISILVKDTEFIKHPTSFNMTVLINRICSFGRSDLLISTKTNSLLYFFLLFDTK